MVDGSSHWVVAPLFYVQLPTMAASSNSPNQSDDLAVIIQALQEDRRWLLHQLDEERWSPFRLDLASLERELGQLLEFCETQGECS